MKIISLDRKNFEYFELEYAYDTSEYYEVSMHDEKNKKSLELVKKSFGEKRHYANTDTLFQAYWNEPRAFAVTDEKEQMLGFLEIDVSEWNNTLVVTQLLVKPEYRGRGVGTMLVNFVKDIAKKEDYRVISLETQNTNVPAIEFYEKNGFVFAGGNIFFYSNDDLGENEVMLQMAYTL